MLRVSEDWLEDIPPASYPYWDRVRHAARLLKSDGCTGVMDWYLDACLEHDIHWRTGLTLYGQLITTEQANRRFRLVIQNRSGFGVLSPVSWIRWAGVTVWGLLTRSEA